MRALWELGGLGFGSARVALQLMRLTWSGGLLRHRQRHLRERQDIHVRTVLGGRRGQGGHVCVVLISVHILELLESRKKKSSSSWGQQRFSKFTVQTEEIVRGKKKALAQLLKL